MRNINQRFQRFFVVGLMSLVFPYATVAEASPDTNLALGKPAIQGSTGWGGSPLRAVDGNRNGAYKKGSVTHTGKRSRSRNNWWQLDLQAEAAISEIKVFNRTDCCANRLGGAKVYISSSPYSGDVSAMQEVHTLGAGTSEQAIVLDEAISGRYVVVKATGNNYLSLAEVEVFAAEDTITPQNTGSATLNNPFAQEGLAEHAATNLAKNKPVKQGSTGWGGSPSRAVDGNRSGAWREGSVTHTGKRSRSRNNWWQVDLEKQSSISEIKVFNRVDCCSGRLEGAKVYISDAPYTGDISAMREVLTLTGNRGEQGVVFGDLVAEGRYVVVKATGNNYLSLAEVEVIGFVNSGAGYADNETVGQTNDQQQAETEGHHNHSPEHMRVFNLVSDEAATHVAVQSGAWEEPATWGGSVPVDGARVIITEGVEVEVNSKLNTALRTLRVDGKLLFNPFQDTEMTFDTMVVNTSGTLQIGSEDQAIEGSKTARLVVADYNGEGFEFIDSQSPDYDPGQLGLGIISMGAVQMFGQEKTPYVPIGELEKSTTVISLDEIPQGWKAGDKIVITNGHDDYGNTGHDQYKNAEIRRIESIDNGVLTLNKALAQAHRVSKQQDTAPTFDLHILNMERNIKIETIESGRAGTKTTSTSYRDYGKETFKNRGHIMLMGSHNVSINYVELAYLGRSSKQLPANDTVFNDDGTVESIGTNQRARYPMHFHRAGADSMPAVVKGSSVFFGPGWGYVNHGSNVDMINNVAFGVAGASFATERGDEQGSFVGNFSAGTYGGSNTKWHKRGGIGDFGHTGNGFWFQGLNITVKDNIANGCDEACYNFVAIGIDGISNAQVAGQQIIEFDNNIAYNAGTGLMAWGMKRGSEFKNFKAYAVKTGVHTTLARSLKFNNTVLLAHKSIRPDQSVGTGIFSGYKTLGGFSFKDSYIVGFGTGLYTPWGHGATIENGYFDNDTDIAIRNTMLSRRVNNTVKGDVTFVNGQNNMTFGYNGGKEEKPRHLYTVRNITLDIASMGKKYAAYDYSQAADYVPFKRSGPAEFKGLTNAEIVEKAGDQWYQWAKAWRVNNSSLKQLVPGGKMMPEGVTKPDNMVNLYLEELGEASVPTSSMPLPEGRTSGSTLEVSATGVVSETITVPDVQGEICFANGVCIPITGGTGFIPVVPADY